MATIEINQLPAFNGVQLSDSIHVYTLSGVTYVPSVHKLSELSSFIFSGEQMKELKTKYNSLVRTFAEFKKWFEENYFTQTKANQEITKPAQFKTVYDSVYSVDKVKEDYLNEYATPQDLENLRTAIYAYVENRALEYGHYRKEILQSVQRQDIVYDFSSADGEADDDNDD